MITKRTKMQLLVFALITMIGVTYVSARYARLDRVLFDDRYSVVAHFAEPGGIYQGAEVDYRGVMVGEVEKMTVTDEGVDLHLGIDNKWDRIPADTIAVVANRSAVGEQYVDLQPQSSDRSGPYLDGESQIAMDDTHTPISTTKLLEDSAVLANDVDKKALRTSVGELGTAFYDTGDNLSLLMDQSNSIIKTANANFDVTKALIRDSNTVLQTQLDSESAIRSFSHDLRLFSTSLVDNDKYLRSVIDNGSATANQLRTFLEDNEVELADLINNLVTTNRIVYADLGHLEHWLVIYPYMVEGGWTVLGSDQGEPVAWFGVVLTQDPPVCKHGYEPTDRREADDLADRKMVTASRCSESPGTSDARGAQNAPQRVAPGTPGAPKVVATYDMDSGKLSWTDQHPNQPLDVHGSLAPATYGQDSWKWLWLQPLASSPGVD